MRGKGSKSSNILLSFRKAGRSSQVAVLANESVAAFLTIQERSSHEAVSSSIARALPFSAILATPTTAALRTDSCQSSNRGAIQSMASWLPDGTRAAIALMADSRTVPIWSKSNFLAAEMVASSFGAALFAMVSMAARLTPQSVSSSLAATAACTCWSKSELLLGCPGGPVISANVLSPAIRVHSHFELTHSSVADTARSSPTSMTFDIAA
mmetsp:Transcript_2130/g.5400  ORF Transcript_2130/g.5400 Transcript_2130/m.5400 type:complete len:211 (-) Transcript_2130:458-1090(-)